MLFRQEDGLLAARDIMREDDPYLAWSQFIDNFRASDAPTRERMVAAEPPDGPDLDRAFAARVAATVEALCHEAGMRPPAWVYASRFTLAQPYWAFGVEDPAARDYFRRTSPPEFASRNLFCGGRALSRV